MLSVWKGQRQSHLSGADLIEQVAGGTQFKRKLSIFELSLLFCFFILKLWSTYSIILMSGVERSESSN